MAGIETSSHVDCYLLYQIVARLFLGNFTNFGSIFFNIRKVINVQSRRGQTPTPPPLPPPV